MRKGFSVPRDFSWIENYKLSWFWVWCTFGSWSQMFLLFFSLALSLLPVLESYFSIHIYLGFVFAFVPETMELCHQLSPACKLCLSIFNSQWMLPNSKHGEITICPWHLWYCFLCIILFLSNTCWSVPGPLSGLPVNSKKMRWGRGCERKLKVH